MEEINGPMEVGTPTSLTNKNKGLRRNWKETHYDSVNDLTLKKKLLEKPEGIMWFASFT